MDTTYETNDEWFETKYPNCFINKQGKIKKVYKSIEKIYTGFIDKRTGYLQVSMGKTLGKKNIHRLLGETFLPNPNNLKDIDHKDRNKLNNSLDNLRWFSRTDNNLNRSHLSGIYYITTNNYWIAKSGLETIGYFKTEDEARACKYGYLRAKGISTDDIIGELPK